MKNDVHRIAGMTFETSEQHKAQRSARKTRDYSYSIKILKFLLERNPFDNDVDYLINIETGEVADKAVNIFDAKSIGDVIVGKMVGESVFGYSFTRKNMAVNMNKSQSNHQRGKSVEIASGCCPILCKLTDFGEPSSELHQTATQNDHASM